MPAVESNELKDLRATKTLLEGVIAKNERAPEVIERKKVNLAEVNERIAELTSAAKPKK